MSKIVIEHDDKRQTYTVIGESRAGEFVISGPWPDQQTAEQHAQLIIGLFNEAAAGEIAKAKESASRMIVLP
jgi:hypothetical protein